MIDETKNNQPDDDAGVYVIFVNRRYSLRDIALLRVVQKLVGEGINHAGIKRIIELESAVANMAVEVAQLRIEVNALIEQNPPKGLATRRKNEVIIYKED